MGPVPDAAQPPRGGFHPCVHALWGSQPGLALTSLDWAPGTGDEKRSLCQNPSTGVVGGPRLLQKHESRVCLLLPTRFPTFSPQHDVTAPANHHVAGVQRDPELLTTPRLQVGWTSCASSGVRRPSDDPSR